jgi:tRNA(Ile)-lysidine synthase
VLQRVREGGLLAPGRAVVVLYSGGRDSTCLLDLAVRIAGPGAVSALHVNYGLRDAAAEDERHCRALCAALGVELEVRRPDRIRATGGSDSGNLQAWARDRRYAAATEIAAARGAEIAAGHTSTDQVETILYRLASSPSRRALFGMRSRDGLLIRPLLQFTRAQTAAYCAARGLTWREDESNESDVYARGRIRHGLVPALAAAHPAAEANVLALAEILREEGAVLDELVDAVLDGRHEISLGRLRELPAALRRLVVQRLADGAVGGPAAGVGRRADDVTAMNDRGSCALDLPHGVRATATSGVVRFGRTPRERRARQPDAPRRAQSPGREASSS